MTLDKMLYISNVQNILKKIGFDDLIIDEAIRYFITHNNFLFKMLSATELNQVDLFNEDIHSRRFNSKKALMFHLFRTAVLIKKYKTLGIDESIAIATLSDILIHQREHYMKTKRIGLSKISYQWLNSIHDLKIFKLGSIQYEIDTMKPFDWKGVKYNDDAFDTVPIGSAVLNIHVQSGEDISEDAVNSSLRQASEFFEKFFPEQNSQIYICNSWLLYKGNKHLLGDNSNIIGFARRFTIIGESNDPGMAIERIYGKRYRLLSSYPKDTSLQRSGMGNFKYFGVGCGYFIYC